MDLVEDLADPIVPITRACRALGVSCATLYRNTRPPPPRRMSPRAPSPRRVSDIERATILAAVHSAEFADQAVMEIYATLLSRGTYLASIRTMYRILAARGETRERRNQRRPHVYAKPSLTATAPNQVWTWDITKLATTAVGVFLHAYVIIDLFSRYVVGWMVASKESKHLAAQLFAETIARHGVEPGLTLHADRGSAMKSDTLAQLLATLGVQRSFSRPHVSDDNAFSESQFKTLKYQPLPRAFHRRAPRPWLARAVLRVAQRRAPPLQPRAVHSGRGLLRPRRRGAHRAPGGTRCRLRRAPRALRTRPASRPPPAQRGQHQPHHL